MHEEAPDRAPEGPADRLVHEEAPGAPADRLGDEAEKLELAFASGAEVEFQEADIATVVHQGKVSTSGSPMMAFKAASGMTRRLNHIQSSPMARNSARKRGRSSVIRSSDQPLRTLQALQARARAHLEIGDDRGDLAGRQVRVAAERRGTERRAGMRDASGVRRSVKPPHLSRRASECNRKLRRRRPDPAPGAAGRSGVS